jgi:hypothetical protein
MFFLLEFSYMTGTVSFLRLVERVPMHPDIWLFFHGNQPSASAGGYASALGGIFGYLPFKPRVVRGGGQQSTGSSSLRQQGTCTLSARRKAFWSTRYMCLVDWKEDLPVNKVLPCWPQDGTISRPRGTPLGLENLQGLKAKRFPLKGIPGGAWIATKIPTRIGHPNPLAVICWARRVSAMDSLRPSLVQGTECRKWREEK